MNKINRGILLEDTQTLLKWGDSLETLAKSLSAKREEKKDRIIYNWGEHVILNGLKINLSTTIWKSFLNFFSKPFNEINSWVIGDMDARGEYDRISEHLKENLGPPHESGEGDESEKYLKWNLSNTSVLLHLFEQHCYKLVLTIKSHRF